MLPRATEVRVSLERGLRAHVASPGDRVYHTPPLVFLTRDGLTLAIDPEAPNWLSTNEMGGAVLRLADGRRTVREIADAVHARFPAAEAEDLAEAVSRFLDDVSGLGAASLGPFARPPYRGRADAVAPGRLSELYVFVTNDCNLRCTHCYVSSGDYVPPDELTTTELLRLVDDARDLGVSRFYFTGGEPFMRKDIFELIDHVCRDSELVILTNATYFNPTVLARLIDAAERANGKPGEGAPRRLHMQVSVDGPDAALHEAIRGPKTFERTLQGIRDLVALDLTPAVSTSVSTHNLDRMAETTRLLGSLGVKEHHILWLQERGRAYENNDLLIPPERITAVMRELSEVAQSLGMTIDNEASHRVRIRGKRGRKTDLCNCGYESLDVFSDGQVYPCVWFSGAPNLGCGSIRERSLREIWLESPILQAIRDNSVQKREGCSGCHLKFLCGGGTSCSSYFDSLATTGRGSFQAAEPYCETFMDLTYDLLWDLATPATRDDALVPRLYGAMEGEGAVCARPNTVAVDHGVDVGSFHCACVLQADVAEGQRVRERARRDAEEAGDLRPVVAAGGTDLRAAPAGAIGITSKSEVPVEPRKRHLPLAALASRAAPDVAESVPFDQVFDGMGQSCVDLLLPMAKVVKALAKGQILKVVTDDLAAREDLGAWCRMTGHDLVSTEKHGTYASYFVRRG